MYTCGHHHNVDQVNPDWNGNSERPGLVVREILDRKCVICRIRPTGWDLEIITYACRCRKTNYLWTEGYGRVIESTARFACQDCNYSSYCWEGVCEGELSGSIDSPPVSPKSMPQSRMIDDGPV